ncbi:hypothetical protein FA95DRAFT_1467023, partial [Auriscalpium vulgare]
VGLRVDWLKERARVRRWDEEVKHLQEEMPRAVRFLQQKAEWWRGRAQQRPEAPADVCDGLQAYAARHAAMYDDIASAYQSGWTAALASHGLTARW